MFYVLCFMFCVLCFVFYVLCFVFYVLCFVFYVLCFMFYVLHFMFCVLCFIFYVLCFVFYVLCFVFYVPRTKTKNQSPKVLIEIGVLELGTRLKLQLAKCCLHKGSKTYVILVVTDQPIFNST